MMPFNEIFKSRHWRKLLEAMMTISTMGFSLHRPAEVLVIIDYGEDTKAVRELVEAMAKSVRHSAKLDYTPVVRCLELDAKGTARDGNEIVEFPRRKVNRCVLGCIDPRLARVRTEIEVELLDASWLTIPGCLYHLTTTRKRAWSSLRRWARENLRYAKTNLGMCELIICPHEDCKAHPVKVEGSGKVNSLNIGLERRITATKAAIGRLCNDKFFCGLKYSIVPISLDGRPLAIKEGKRGSVHVRLVPAA
ncbi:MAG: hypothetical protein V4664_03075 [Patescibacteria group bacterium]